MIRRNLHHVCTACAVALLPATAAKVAWLAAALVLVGVTVGVLGVVLNPQSSPHR